MDSLISLIASFSFIAAILYSIVTTFKLIILLIYLLTESTFFNVIVNGLTLSFSKLEDVYLFGLSITIIITYLLN